MCDPIQVPTPAAIVNKNKSILGNSEIVIFWGAPRCVGEFCEDQPRWAPNMVSLADVFAIDREPACCKICEEVIVWLPGVRINFLFATCHHVIVWNVWKDDVEIELGRKRAQWDLNVWQHILTIFASGNGRGGSGYLLRSGSWRRQESRPGRKLSLQFLFPPLLYLW